MKQGNTIDRLKENIKLTERIHNTDLSDISEEQLVMIREEQIKLMEEFEVNYRKIKSKTKRGHYGL